MKPATAEILRIEGLCCGFSGHEILNNVRLAVRQGEFISFLGPSGCGKTTLLRIIAGLEKVQRGNVDFRFLDGRKVQVAMAFQKFPLIPWLTILENITICMNNEGLSHAAKREKAMAYLGRAHLARFASHRPADVSGGMQQKANILRSFCSGAELILMDEPFVFLDFVQRRELQEFTLEIWGEERKTVIFVTHNVSEAITLSDRILLMGGSPGNFIQEFKIDLPRPRAMGELRKTPRFNELFEEIVAPLDREIMHLQRRLREQEL